MTPNKIKQRIEEDIMIHKLAKEIADEYLEPKEYVLNNPSVRID